MVLPAGDRRTFFRYHRLRRVVLVRERARARESRRQWLLLSSWERELHELARARVREGVSAQLVGTGGGALLRGMSAHS